MAGSTSRDGTAGIPFTLSVVDLELIGVPFDSYARAGAVARAPHALRKARLIERLSRRHNVLDAGDLELPAPLAERAPRSGLLNQPALLALISAARDAINKAYLSHRFPILVGGDCAVLLGALPAVRDRYGEAAMLFLDGHEDAFPLELSPDGQAADSELGLALGLTGDAAPSELRDLLPMLEPERVAMLGIRNSDQLEQNGVRTLRGRLLLRSDREIVEGDPEEIVRTALEAMGAGREGWWLHTDLDVLRVDAFAAQDFPEPGGIGWEELDRLTSAALASGGCAGWSVVIYNPDLDADGSVAHRIVRFICEAARAIQ